MILSPLLPKRVIPVSWVSLMTVQISQLRAIKRLMYTIRSIKYNRSSWRL